jgi:CMP-N,N'-diacetyllegionaminic acid synthase
MEGALAIILARGGSKGVPGKNVAVVGGKPCIAWTIEHALKTAGIRRVVVSSDDAAALQVASQLGVEGIKRPGHLATDTATIDDAARHAHMVSGPYSETMPIVILYANVPVRPRDLTQRALERLAHGCDSVQSYARVGKHHPWWTVKVSDQGEVAPWEGKVLYHGVYRRQELPPAFVPDGGVIAVTRASLFGEIAGVQSGPHAFFGKDRRGIINDEGAVVDIDSKIDLFVADAILSGR